MVQVVWGAADGGEVRTSGANDSSSAVSSDSRHPSCFTVTGTVTIGRPAAKNSPINLIAIGHSISSYVQGVPEHREIRFRVIVQH